MRRRSSAFSARLTARFMLLSNELPKLNDSSGALPGRMILLRLTQSWYGQEDTALPHSATYLVSLRRPASVLLGASIPSPHEAIDARGFARCRMLGL